MDDTLRDEGGTDANKRERVAMGSSCCHPFFVVLPKYS